MHSWATDSTLDPISRTILEETTEVISKYIPVFAEYAQKSPSELAQVTIQTIFYLIF